MTGMALSVFTGQRPSCTSELIGTLLFLLYATAIAHADVEETEVNERDVDSFYENGCPRDTSITKLLPHENCGQYYLCFHGAMISRFCPNGLRFNVDLERCDWHARCYKTQNNTSFEELESSNPKHALQICSADDSNGVLVAHDNCNEFYKCSYGRPVPLKCAEGLLFNTVNGKCTQEQYVDCGERINLLSDSNTISIENDSITTQFTMDTESTPKDIRKFVRSYIAAQNKITPTDTGNIEKDNDNEENESSGEDINSDADNIEKSNNNEANEFSDIENEITAIEICAADNSNEIRLSHKKCNYFYKCLDSTPVVFNCPGTLLFNPRTNDCDWPTNVNCGNRIDSNDTNSNNTNDALDPAQAHAICSTEGSDGMTVSHDSCNKFYRCHFGAPIVVKCPGILLFNSKTKNCDWPTHVDCRDRTVLENTYSTDSYLQNEHIIKKAIAVKPNLREANVICAADNSDRILIPHENCNQYYKCFQRKAIALFCQTNLYYNPEKEYCDWLHNVNCTSRIIYDNIWTDEEERKNPNEKCKDKADGSVVPHDNCSQFYKCINGQSYSMTCRTGLYFNNLLNICDWPMNVDCGERLTDAEIQNNERLE